MSAKRSSVLVGLVALVGIASARLTLQAQDGREREPEPVRSRAEKPNAPVSVQDALERPFAMPFGRPTSLEEVASHLSRTLHAPVLLDRAALDRQDVRPSDTVQLELQGVRLKIGLKYLLDQVDLTYRVVPEDNLLVLTDAEGSDDPLKQVLHELKALHRDVHDVQDAVDDILSVLGMEEDGPKVHKPTIIEEMPAEPAEKKPAIETPAPRTRPGA
jgi:hypothetical protein